MQTSLKQIILGISGFPAIGLAVIYLMWPHWQQSGFLSWNDWHLHLFFANEFAQQLAYGNFYPRWIADTNDGFGAPIFNYYPPLAYYLSALFNVWLQDIVLAMKAVMSLSLLSAGMGCYCLFRQYTTKVFATIAALGFINLPHILLLSYPLNMYSTMVAWAFIPWVFYGMMRIKSWQPTWIVFTSIMFSLTLLAHITSAVQVAILMGMMLLIHKRRLPIIVSLLLGGLFAAIYWVPAWFERDLVHFDWLLQDLTYHHQFLFRGWLDIFVPFAKIMAVFNQMNIVLTATFVGLLYALIFVFRPTQLTWSIMLMVCGCWLLMTPLTEWLWQLPLLYYMEFPWRWQGLFGFGCLWLLAIFLMQVWQQWQDQSQRTLLIGLLVLVMGPLSALWFYFSPLVTTWRKVDLAGQENYLQIWTGDDALAWVKQDAWSPLEYRPQTAGANWQRDLVDDKLDTFTVLDGVAYVSYYIDQGYLKQWKIEVGSEDDQRPATLLIKTFYFPNWQLYLDGQPIPISLNSDHGVIEFQAAPGQHAMRLVFTDSKIQAMAKYLSIISVIIACLWLLFGRRFLRNDLNNAATADHNSGNLNDKTQAAK